MTNQSMTLLRYSEKSQCITDHDMFYAEMINCLPAKQYLPIVDEENPGWMKYQKNTKRKAATGAKKSKRAKFALNTERNTDIVKRCAEPMHGTMGKATSSRGSINEATIGILRSRLQCKIQKCQMKRKNAIIRQKNPVQHKTPESIGYGNLLMGKDDVTKSSTVPRELDRKCTKQNLLRKVEANKRRIEELKQTMDGKDVAREEQLTVAIKKAAGEKVIDDPKLIKKAIKRKEKLKQRSTKQWRSRLAGNVEQKRKQMGPNDKHRNKRPRAGFEGESQKVHLRHTIKSVLH